MQHFKTIQQYGQDLITEFVCAVERECPQEMVREQSYVEHFKRTVGTFLSLANDDYAAKQAKVRGWDDYAAKVIDAMFDRSYEGIVYDDSLDNITNLCEELISAIECVSEEMDDAEYEHKRQLVSDYRWMVL